ncbi:RNA recognition motif containing protein [Colletotrichum truncatum]|uniref:RNA recognition motif containing protein n=1 Tax=Colletotrichum truncatum TaxID=5467 RepID=A0ACC3YGZ8_COLTU|nr:RNA recognition motif containing protein [Colletotrichum truncatum]KAF6792727.1 RNA recognition motif containing protein [Colletotrichum truncatum]
MAPKKKEQQKMSLGDFLQDQSYGGSWADEVEDTYSTQALPPPERAGYRPTGGGWGSSGGDRPERRDYGGYSSIRENLPQTLPDKPPYTAHLGNLSYDATVDTVTEFFEGCNIINVRIIEDREQQRPKGFAYAEFQDVEGLKQALTLDGQSFQGRVIRIKVADPPRGGDRGESTRDFGDWTRKGPLPDLPGRGGNDRRGSDFGERRAPREPREPREDDGKVRDFGNWERRGPLSPLPQEESGPREGREGSRPRTNDGPREFRNRRESPAAWGEGQQPRQDSRPPRPERAPTAAEQDNQWRTKMRPDAAAKSGSQSRDGSEAPPSPATSAAAPVGRPRLNLTKRTVSEATDVLSPSATDSKASPFGAARPIDTAAKERQIEEKKQQLLKEKREADEKAKEERRLAKEAAAKEAADKEAADKAQEEAAKANSEKKAAEEAPKEESEPAKEGAESKADGASDAQKAQPKEPRENAKSRANESNNWRSASSGERGPRGPPTGPRRGGPGGPRGGRFEGGARPPRSNGGPAASQQPSTPAADGEAAPVEDDGWTTVPNKSRRNVGPRGTA